MSADESYRSLVERSPDVISRHSATGAFLYASPACAAVFGHDPAEILGRSPEELAHPDDAAGVRQALAAAAAFNRPVSVAYRLRDGRGEYRCVESRLSATRDPATGAVSELTCVSRPLPSPSARPQAGPAPVAERAQKGEEPLAQAGPPPVQFDTLIEMIPGVIWEAYFAEEPPHIRYAFVSDYIETLTGYTREEWMASPALWNKIADPDDEASVAALARENILRGGGSMVYRWVRKDGRTIWIENHLRVIRDASGTPVGMCGLTMDVTARVEAEQRNEKLLRKATELGRRLDELVATIPGVVWEGRLGAPPSGSVITFVNDYIQAMSGYTREEWFAMPDNWRRMIHPEDHDVVQKSNEELFVAGQVTAQFRWIRADQRVIWIENHMRLVCDREGKPVGARGLVLDVTARKQAEEEQVRLQQEIIRVQAQTLAELSTPLIPISGEVLVLPLIGALDEARLGRVMETLLSGIQRARAQVAIVDVTGVPSLDATSADAILRVARAVGLLGAEVVLTGIRPALAQALVALGADLGGIETRGTLQSGIAYAMGPRRRSRSL